MNLTLILVAGLALAAPAALFTYEAVDGDRASWTAAADAPHEASAAASATADASAAAGAAPAPGTLIIRIALEGRSVVGELSVAPIGTHDHSAEVMLVDGDNLFTYALDPALEYEVGFEASTPMGPLDLMSGSFSGSGGVSFAECGAIEYLIQVVAHESSSGIAVYGAQCMPGPVRHVGMELSGPSVTFPYPTCPLDCSVSYRFGGTERMQFEVPEGATAIDVSAHWNPESPMTETLSVWLATPDAACGEGCWRVVAHGEGAGMATFTYDAPAAGVYSLSSHVVHPAGATVDQAVWFEAVVHTS